MAKKKKATKKVTRKAKTRPKRSAQALTNKKTLYQYMMIGGWVTARCLKRLNDYNKSMPLVVREWLEEGGHSHVDENTRPSDPVHRWVARTIQDPNWEDT